MNEVENKKEYAEKNDRPTNASQAFDLLLSSVGNGGKWQWKIMLLCSLSGVFVSFPSMGAVFLAATPDHLCDLPFVNDLNKDSSYSQDDIRNFTTPWITSKDGTPKMSECLYYDRKYNEISIQTFDSYASSGNISNTAYTFDDHNNNLEDSDQIKCSNWSYVQSIFKTTVVTEWNLVCDDKWKKPLIQSTYMLGYLTGGLFASAFSDRIGRRSSTLVCTFIYISSIILTTFSNSLTMFIILRFLTGGSGIGMYLINFVLVMETCGMKHRNIIGHIHGCAWIFGCLWLTLMAFLLRDWRHLQLSISIPALIMLCYYWFIPESPRWLLMQGRTAEGIEGLRKIGEANGGKELPKKEEMDYALGIIREEILKERELKSTSIHEIILRFCKNVFSLVRTPNMRRRSLIVFLSWFVVAMSYYGLARVSLYVMSLIGALVEFPGTFFCYYTAIKFGRRITLCSSLCLAGASCILILFVPVHIGWLKLVFALCGRMFSGSAFTAVYFFSIELVPTNIRNISIGIANMNARIGSSLAPFVVDLLGQVYYAIPSTIFGILSLLAGLLALLLPETSGFGLPESIDQIESLPR